ncbi:unnamed protein product, partial [Amoebophrya sp. A120]
PRRSANHLLRSRFHLRTMLSAEGPRVPRWLRGCCLGFSCDLRRKPRRRAGEGVVPLSPVLLQPDAPTPSHPRLAGASGQRADRAGGSESALSGATPRAPPALAGPAVRRNAGGPAEVLCGQVRRKCG